MRVLVLDSLFDSLEVEEAAAARHGATVQRWDGEPSQLRDADVVAHVQTRIDATVIAKLRHCRVIARFGTGLDTVDLEAARCAGIAVVGVRDYCVPELCAHTLALAFGLVRRVRDLSGVDLDWQDVAATTPISRYGTAAVIGMGSIGSAVAAALLAIGFEVIAVTEHGKEAARELGAAVMPLGSALPEAELVLVHAALTASTRNLLDDRALRQMRPHAILVNTARIGLLDQHAAAQALAEHRLGGLALDARLDAASPLRRFANDPRVLVTPHIGWYSEESATTLRAATISNALQCLANLKPREVSGT